MNIKHRDDISDSVIHFTKPKSHISANTFDSTNEKEIKGFLEESLNVFIKIMEEKTLLAGTTFIKGNFNCICFTEAPISKLPSVFSNRVLNKIRYAPYGFMFKKKWLYKNGARPVIYGPESDYNCLDENLKYRYVKYNLESDPEIDFTWEREWRLKTQSLQFDPSDVTLVVPNRAVVDSIRYKDGGDPHSNWHFIALSDLGLELDSI